MKFSIEIFPPRDGNAAFVTNAFLGAGAEYISVTYGAGGAGGTTSRNRSMAVVSQLAQAGVPMAAHITIAGQARYDVDKTLETWHAMGVRRYVALRGDGDGPGKAFAPHHEGYGSSCDLIRKIASLDETRIAVAAYPNGHADSRGLDADVDYLKAKEDAGATEAIAQFFFEPDAFLRFRDRCAARNVGIPVVPGILPVFSYQKISEFARQCGEPVPQWLTERFSGIAGTPELHQQVAVATAASLCEGLSRHGVDRVHIYSCNQVNTTVALAHIIRHPTRLQQAA